VTAIWRALARGAAAGAAGTGARYATAALDPTGPQRPVPDGCLRRIAINTGTGSAIGATAGALRSAGVRLPNAVGGPLLGAAGLVASGGPTALRRVLDPRRWPEVDWARDALPQLAFGVAAHQGLVVVSRVAEGREPVPPAPPATLLRAAALGAASGARSSAGITAVALTSARSDPGVIAPRLGGSVGAVLLGVLTAAEVVADKRTTGSRLQPASLLSRAVLGAVAAGTMARRDDDDPALPAVIGLATAALGSVAGYRLRAATARLLGTDRPGAVAEDLLAGLLSWFGARRGGSLQSTVNAARPGTLRHSDGQADTHPQS
jgi:uncharacterized membrane protein